MGRLNWRGANYANLAVSFGVMMCVSVFLGFLAGNWLDQRFHSAPIFLVIFIILGVFLGFYSLIKEILLLELIDKQNKSKKDK
jgi:ATP synthase protein I